MTPDYPKPPFPSQKQPMPGSTDAMQPRPDHGEKTYMGSGRLRGLKAVITGATAALVSRSRLRMLGKALTF